MKPGNTYLRTVCTHLLGLGMGMGLGLAIWHATQGEDKADKPSGETAQRQTTARSAGRRERPNESRSGVEVLKAIIPHLFAERTGNHDNHGRTFSYADHLKNSMDRLIKSADELAPAEDVASSAIALLEMQAKRMNTTLSPEDVKKLAELQPRLLHWLRQDPEAAIKHIFDDNRRQYMDLGVVAFAAIHEKGVDAALGWLKGRDPRNAGQLSFIFANYIATQGDLTLITKVKEGVHPQQWSSLRNQIFSSWPFDKADEILAIAQENNAPGSLAYLAMRNGKKGAEWLMKHMDSGEMDPAFRQALENSQEYRQYLENSTHIPIEKRVEVLAKNRRDDKDAEQLTLELGGKDVAAALNRSEKDWRFAFRNGKVTFEEVYAAVAADLPDLANTSPDAIRLQVFKELAEENGPAALEALAHTPEPDKWVVALKPTQWMFYNVDPQKFYDYLQAIPHDDPTLHQARFESWVWHSQSNISLYSRDYVEWVKNMPEGIDREMAAIGILRSVTPNDKAMHDEVDSWVKDPAMRARIQAPPPK